MYKYFIRFFQNHLSLAFFSLFSISINGVKGQWTSLDTQYPDGFLDIHFFTVNEGIVSYNSPEGVNYILRTKNGGNSWDTIGVDELLNLPPNSIMNHFFFINDSIGFACSGFLSKAFSTELLLKTSDSGYTWQSIFNDTGIFFTDIFFTNQYDGFATGFDRKIFKSNDGGKSWILKNYRPDSYENLYAIWFTSDSVGYATGGSMDPFDGKNLILKTTDAGETWNENYYETGRFVGAIHFPTPDVGYAAGAWGKIMKTSNRGNDWQILYSGTNLDFYKIYFVDVNTGFVIGDSGAILKTSDGGKSWIFQKTGTNKYMYGISFINKDTGFVCGGSGLILKTYTGGDSITSVRDLSDKKANNRFYVEIAGGDDYFNLSLFNRKKNLTIFSIFTPLGQQCYTQILNNPLFHLDVKFLKTGNYVFYFNNGSEIFTKLVFKQ